MNLQDIKEKLNAKEKFGKLTRRIKKNDIVAEWYEMLYDDTGEETFPRVAQNVRDCSKLWDIDYYRFQGVKDILRTNLCKNRFCDNCQNTISIQRERKYAPFLDALAKNFDIYHIVFTIPNPEREELRPAVENMYKQIGYIIRLFTGNAKIKGYDFAQYGFLGAVRALEITKGSDGRTFHPHFHCLFVLKKGLLINRKRVYVNSFSFNNPDVKKSHKRKEYGKPERYFSAFEILLQKIWRLRVDGVKVTNKSLCALKEGYSVVCENSAGKYKEVFKYATKGIFKEGDDKVLQGYVDFVPLYYTLYRRKLIQGYGVLNRFRFNETIEQDARADEAYQNVVRKLRELESPQRVFEFLSEINNELQSKNITYISRSSIGELMGEEYGE